MATSELWSISVEGVSLAIADDGRFSITNHRLPSGEEEKQQSPVLREGLRYHVKNTKKDAAPCIVDTTVSIGSEETFVVEPVESCRAIGKGVTPAFEKRKTSKRPVRRLVSVDDTVMTSGTASICSFDGPQKSGAENKDVPPFVMERKLSERSFLKDHAKNDRAPIMIDDAVSIRSEETLIVEPLESSEAPFPAPSFAARKASSRTIRRVVSMDCTPASKSGAGSNWSNGGLSSWLSPKEEAQEKQDAAPMLMERKASERSFLKEHAKKDHTPAPADRSDSSRSERSFPCSGSIVHSVAESTMPSIDENAWYVDGSYPEYKPERKDGPPMLMERKASERSFLMEHAKKDQQPTPADRASSIRSERSFPCSGSVVHSVAESAMPSIDENAADCSYPEYESERKDGPPILMERKASERSFLTEHARKDRKPPAPMKRKESERSFLKEHAKKDRQPTRADRVDSIRSERTTRSDPGPTQAQSGDDLDDFDDFDDMVSISSSQSRMLSRHERRLQNHRSIGVGYVSDFLKDPSEKHQDPLFTQSDHSPYTKKLLEASFNESIPEFGEDIDGDDKGLTDDKPSETSTPKKSQKTGRTKRGSKRDSLTIQSDHTPSTLSFYDSIPEINDIDEFGVDNDQEDPLLNATTNSSNSEEGKELDGNNSLTLLDIAKEDASEVEDLNKSRRMKMLTAQKSNNKMALNGNKSCPEIKETKVRKKEPSSGHRSGRRTSGSALQRTKSRSLSPEKTPRLSLSEVALKNSTSRRRSSTRMRRTKSRSEGAPLERSLGGKSSGPAIQRTKSRSLSPEKTPRLSQSTSNLKTLPPKANSTGRRRSSNRMRRTKSRSEDPSDRSGHSKKNGGGSGAKSSGPKIQRTKSCSLSPKRMPREKLFLSDSAPMTLPSEHEDKSISHPRPKNRMRRTISQSEGSLGRRSRGKNGSGGGSGKKSGPAFQRLPSRSLSPERTQLVKLSKSESALDTLCEETSLCAETSPPKADTGRRRSSTRMRRTKSRSEEPRPTRSPLRRISRAARIKMSRRSSTKVSYQALSGDNVNDVEGDESSTAGSSQPSRGSESGGKRMPRRRSMGLAQKVKDIRKKTSVPPPEEFELNFDSSRSLPAPEIDVLDAILNDMKETINEGKTILGR